MAKEVGVTGNQPIYGTMQTGEYLSKLGGAAGRAIFDEMRRSDPMIRAVRDSVDLPIIRADWAVEPASDASQDVEIAEAVHDNLVGGGMTITWPDVVRQALLMADYGFSVFEKVYELRDGVTALRKLDPRLPTSIDSWEYDAKKRELASIVQLDPITYQKIKIPIAKCVVFTNRREGDNWEGVSDLRAAYGSWWMKNTLLKINAIKHDRYGSGVPQAEAPEGVKQDDSSWTAMESSLEAIYSQEKSYIVTPAGWKITLLSAGQNAGTDVLPSIRYLDERIAVSVLAQFLNLGSTETGSRALGQSFIDFFLLSLQQRADYIADIVNRFVIRELVNYNWSVDDYPTITAGQIAPLGLEAIAKLKTAGVLSHDLELENTVRRALGIDEIEELPEPVVPVVESPAEETPDEVEDAPEEDPEKPAPEEEKAAARARSDPRGARYGTDNLTGLPVLSARELRPEEQRIDWPRIAMQLDTSVEQATAEVLKVRSVQIEKIALLLAGGKRVKDIAVPAKKDQYDALARVYRAMKKLGAEDMESEIRRQVPNAKARLHPKAADPIEERDYDDLVLEQLDLAVNGAADKLKAIMAALAIDLKKAGKIGDELRRLLLQKTTERIGDRTWEDMAHLATNEGYGRGRDDTARDYEDLIERSYRSGVLDTNICDVCFAKDGQEHEWGDPEMMAPDPECEGGARCRCVNIAVMKAESEGTR